ncbi:MAG: acetyltransferase [Nonlabens sp.]
MNRAELEKQYFELGNRLPKQYPNKNLDNHCYWRIALDNAVQDYWKNQIKSPAYKNLSDNQIDRVVELLNNYATDEELLTIHNENSLRWRGKL